MMHHFILKEAINSVAIEHGDDCDCTTCRAADGDHEALAEFYSTMGKQAQ